MRSIGLSEYKIPSWRFWSIWIAFVLAISLVIFTEESVSALELCSSENEVENNKQTDSTTIRILKFYDFPYYLRSASFRERYAEHLDEIGDVKEHVIQREAERVRRLYADIVILDHIFLCESLIRMTELANLEGYSAYHVPLLNSTFHRAIGILSRTKLEAIPYAHLRAMNQVDCGATFAFEVSAAKRPLVVVSSYLRIEIDTGLTCELSQAEIRSVRGEISSMSGGKDILFLGDLNEHNLAKFEPLNPRYISMFDQVFLNSKRGVSMIELQNTENPDLLNPVQERENDRLVKVLAPVYVSSKLGNKLVNLERRLRTFSANISPIDSTSPPGAVSLGQANMTLIEFNIDPKSPLRFATVSGILVGLFVATLSILALIVLRR